MLVGRGRIPVLAGLRRRGLSERKLLPDGPFPILNGLLLKADILTKTGKCLRKLIRLFRIPKNIVTFAQILLKFAKFGKLYFS